MPTITLSDIPEHLIVDGFHARFVHTEGATIAYVRIEAGKNLPEHAHPHEQVTTVISGELAMTIGGVSHTYRFGEVAVIPSNVSHSGTALTDCFVIDVFTPIREDFKARTI